MPIGGGSSGDGVEFSTPKASRNEKEAFGYAMGYNPILLDFLGYEATPFGKSQGIRDQIAALQAQLGSAATPAEAKMLKQQIKGLTKDLKGFKKNAAGDFTFAKREPTPEELKEQEFQDKLTGQYREQLLTGDIHPEQAARINTIYDTMQANTQREIERAAIGAAGRRGLNVTDTPIGDPFLRATGEASANINAERAKGMLGVRESDLNRAAGYMSYLDAFKQLRKFQNPLAAGGYASNLALGLYGPRMGATQATQSGGGGDIFGAVMGGLPGAASLAQTFFSSETLKDNITALSDEDIKLILDSVKRTPVFSWMYKPETGLGDEFHIGPTVEKSAPGMRTKDGLALKGVDYMGVMFAALKGLVDKVERLESAA